MTQETALISDEEIEELERLREKGVPELNPHGGSIRLSAPEYNRDGDEELLCVVGRGPEYFVGPGGFTRSLLGRHSKYICTAANSIAPLIARLKAAETALRFYSTANPAQDDDWDVTPITGLDVNYGKRARAYFAKVSGEEGGE